MDEYEVIKRIFRPLQLNNNLQKQLKLKLKPAKGVVI